MKQLRFGRNSALYIYCRATLYELIHHWQTHQPYRLTVYYICIWQLLWNFHMAGDSHGAQREADLSKLVSTPKIQMPQYTIGDGETQRNKDRFDGKDQQSGDLVLLWDLLRHHTQQRLSLTSVEGHSALESNIILTSWIFPSHWLVLHILEPICSKSRAVHMLLYLQRIFFCLSTYFLILPCFSFPSKSLSEAVYPPSACPPLAKALISHTLSILHKSSHLLSYTPCPHLLKESLSLSHTHMEASDPHPYTHTHTIIPSPCGRPCCRWTYTPFVWACEGGN